MKKRYKFNKASSVVFLLTFISGMFSCQTELLEPKNKTNLSDQVVFDNPSRIELQANNLYDFVKSGNLLGGRFQVYGDIRADDFLNRTSNGVTGYGVWNHSLTENSINDVNNLWNAAYAAINQVNVFIKGMNDNSSKFAPPIFPADFVTVTAPQYIAEARLLRALTYYSLLQLYARPYTDGNGANPGLPLRLQAETSSENNDLARSTVAEVYTEILADLNFAETNLPTTRGSALLNVTRAHRNTAIALKTRVYLSMGDYANVVIEANKIVAQNTPPFSATSGVAHALQATIANVFASPQETAESIFSFPFSAQDTPGTQNQLAYYFKAPGATAPGNGEYSVNPAGILANTTDWPATDARRSFVYVFNTESFLSKYPSGTPYLDKAPVIRYSEVLLNLAEAIARTTAGVDARALALLNAVRQRSDATALAPADNTALIDAIILERRIEFMGEGLRNADIMRLNQTIPAKGAVPSVAFTALEYIWPIPSGELSANALMTRNE
jgi:hypothetical protein